MKKIQVNLGDKYNKLTIIKELPSIPRKDKGVYRLFKCKCDCGNIVNVRLDHLRNGHTTSCGCYNKLRVKETHSKHNLYKHPLYLTWINIKARCYNKNNPEYYCYGGKGIIMCEDWLSDFVPFYDWAINNGWDKSLTIDRIDNDGNYCPENCRWITQSEQLNNTSRNHHIEWNGNIYNIKELSKKIDISYDKLYYRIVQLGWKVEECIKYYK